MGASSEETTPITPDPREGDVEALRRAFEVFSRSTAAMEESYKRLEARVHMLDRELQQKNRLAALGEMAATVAHEIRNPLGGIRGFAALLAKDLEGDPRARHVERILEGVRILERIVGELLDYTRPIDLKRSRCDAVALVRSALEYMPDAQGAVSIEIEPGELSVDADPGAIRQVLLNVLMNAVQSVDGAGRVTVSFASADGEGFIRVSDTGCGIPAESLGRIFSPFFTTREKGTGLGLAVALKTAEAHGGTIDVESEPGRGSVFTLRLPLAGGE